MTDWNNEAPIDKHVVVRPAHEGDVDALVDILWQFNPQVKTPQTSLVNLLRTHISEFSTAVSRFRVVDGKPVTNILGFLHSPKNSYQHTLYLDMDNFYTDAAVTALDRAALLLTLQRDGSAGRNMDNDMIVRVPDVDLESINILGSFGAAALGSKRTNRLGIKVMSLYQDGLRELEAGYQAFAPRME